MLANEVQQEHYGEVNSDRVGMVGTIVQLALIIAASILFNFFPERIGVIRSFTDLSSFRPLLAPEFQAHMPALNLYWGLAAGLCVAHLVLGHWNIITRCADIGLNMLGLGILFQMISGGSLVASEGLTFAIKIGLAGAVIPTCLSVINQIRLVSAHAIIHT